MRLVIKIPDSMGEKLKELAEGHPVYDGNVSALARSLFVSFFAQQDTLKCHATAKRTAGKRLMAEREKQEKPK